MHWADEIRDPHQELELLPKGKTKASSREMDTARELIDALSMGWVPDQFHDTFEERVQALVDAKREGQEIVSEAGPPEATNVIDLMDALQRSVDQARSSRGNRSDKKPAGELHRLPTRRDKDQGTKKQQDKKKTGSKQRTAEDLESLSKAELYERASKADIPGRSKMTREQLIKALGKKRPQPEKRLRSRAFGSKLRTSAQCRTGEECLSSLCPSAGLR